MGTKWDRLTEKPWLGAIGYAFLIVFVIMPVVFYMWGLRIKSDHLMIDSKYGEF